jgi:glutathione S-transferase
MVATLFHIPRTISSPIVQILLELDLVNNPIVVEEISFRALKSREHLAINPMGTSPAFHDSDLDITIWESGAVLTYLLERYDTDYQFYPEPIHSLSTAEDIQLRAKYLHLKQFIIATVYPFVAAMYLHSLKPVEEQDVDYMAAAKHKCQSIFEPVLTKWLGDGPFFLGDAISAVDFLAIKPLRNIHALGWLQEFPALYELFHRVTNRPTYIEAYDGFETKSTYGDPSMILVPTRAKPQIERPEQPLTQKHDRRRPQKTVNNDVFDNYKSLMEESTVSSKNRFSWTSLRNKPASTTTANVTAPPVITSIP